MTNIHSKLHSKYRGFYIERNLMPGCGMRWRAWDFIDGYVVRLSSDTLTGIRKIIKETLGEVA